MNQAIWKSIMKCITNSNKHPNGPPIRLIYWMANKINPLIIPCLNGQRRAILSLIISTEAPKAAAPPLLQTSLALPLLGPDRRNPTQRSEGLGSSRSLTKLQQLVVRILSQENKANSRLTLEWWMKRNTAAQVCWLWVTLVVGVEGPDDLKVLPKKVSSCTYVHVLFCSAIPQVLLLFIKWI